MVANTMRNVPRAPAVDAFLVQSPRLDRKHKNRLATTRKGDTMDIALAVLSALPIDCDFGYVLHTRKELPVRALT
jgi:hypothetical protein